MRKILSAIGGLYLAFIVGVAIGSLSGGARPMPAQSITRGGSAKCGSAGQVLFNDGTGACTSNSGFTYDGTNVVIANELFTPAIIGGTGTGGNLNVRCDGSGGPCTLTLGVNNASQTVSIQGGTLTLGTGTGANMNLQTGVLTVVSCVGCASPSQGLSGTINTSDGAGGWTVPSPGTWTIQTNGSGGTQLFSVQSAGGDEIVLLENTSGPTGIILDLGASAGGCPTCGTFVVDQAGDLTMGGLLTVGKAGNATGGELSLVSTVSGGVDLISDNSTGGILTLQTFGGAAVILNNVNQIFFGSGTQLQSGSNGNIKITDNGATTNGTLTITAINGIGFQKQIFTSSGTFTIPAGVTQVKFTVTGGGGAGGGGTASLTGNGGGAGGTAFKWLTGLTPTHTIVVTVGAGGTAVSGGTGNTGVASSIASGTQTITTVSCNGGSGAGNNTTPGNGGTCTGGDLNQQGSWGNWAVPASGFGGYGGPSFWGGAGIGAFLNGTGNVGNAPGAGGGGGGGNNTNTSGGPGAAGIVVAEWVQ